MTPEQPERDLDKEFEALVAGWDATGPIEDPVSGPDPTGPDPIGPGPGRADASHTDLSPENRGQDDDTGDDWTDRTGRSSGATAAGPSSASGPSSPPPGVNIWRGPTSWVPPENAGAGAGSGAKSESDEDEDEFRPDPVVLPPQEDLHFWGIVVGLVGGGLLLLYVALTGASTSSWWFIGAVGLFVGGFALLILRQPRERDTTDDGTRL
ncbi:MAG: hypothetical protein WCA30_15875 [Dermatophilaceae bacterium]